MNRNQRRKEDRIVAKSGLVKVRAILEKEVKDEIASLTWWGKIRHLFGSSLRSERKLKLFDETIKSRQAESKAAR